MRSDSFDPVSVGRRLNPPHIGTRTQWISGGAPQRMFDDGRLNRVARGLWTSYPLSSLDPDRLVTLLAALQPPDAVIGGWAAALVHGVRDAGPDMMASPASSQPLSVPVYLSRHTHKKLTAFVPLRSDLRPQDIIERNGYRVTTAARTAYDMARFAHGGEREALALLDCFAYQGNPMSISASDVDECVLGKPHGRGNPRVRAVLPLMSDRTRSIPESMIRHRWIVEVGIDSSNILINPTVIDADGLAHEVDLVDVHSGLVAEYDGRHHADAAQRHHDARCAEALHELGLTLIRYTATDLYSSPQVFVARTAGRRRAALAGTSGARMAALIRAGDVAERPLVQYSPSASSLAG